MALCGLLNLHKPSGVTSRRVVDRIQRLVKPAKVGHAGTLDPLASGVLIVGVGQATRLVEYVQQLPKRYRGTFLLGRDSNTEDIEGEVVLRPDASPPTWEQLREAAGKLTGPILQRPPAFSALKVSGQRAYALARGGHDVELAPRTVQIDRLEITAYDYPRLELDIQCGSGTYVRSLGRDLAELVGSHAVMSALVRTAIGRFQVESAIDPEAVDSQNLARHLRPAIEAVADLMPTLLVEPADVRRLSQGQEIAASETTEVPCAAVDDTGRLVAVLTRRPSGLLAAEKFFPE